MLRSKFVKCLMSIMIWQVNCSSNLASFFIFMTQNSPVKFKFIHFLLLIKRPHQSSNFQTSEHGLVKFCYNFSCHFWKHKSVFLQMLCQYSVPSNIPPLYFFFRSNIYFVQKKPIKVQFFEIFESSGQTSSNSLCQFWTDQSIPLQIYYLSSFSWRKTLL